MYVLGLVIKFFYDIVNNYGLAIILFTVFVKVILLPLTVKQQKSMVATQKIQPLLKKLQEKYKNDKEKLNQETMKLYKEHGVNPMGGCLPMLIQLPIILCLWWVIKKPITYIMGVGYDEVWRMFEAIGQYIAATDVAGGVPQELYGNIKGFWDFLAQNAGENSKSIVKVFTDMYVNYVPPVDGTAQAVVESFKTINYSHFGNEEIRIAEYIFNNPEILKSEVLTSVPGLENLKAIDFRFLGLNLADTPNFQTFNWLWSIPVLSGVTSFLTTKISQTGQPQANPDQPNPMQSMTYMFPLISAWFAFSLPAGVGVYWIASNLLQMIQQVSLNKFLSSKDNNGDEGEVIVVEKGRKNRKKSRRRS